MNKTCKYLLLILILNLVPNITFANYGPPSDSNYGPKPVMYARSEPQTKPEYTKPANRYYSNAAGTSTYSNAAGTNHYSNAAGTGFYSSAAGTRVYTSGAGTRMYANAAGSSGLHLD